ncbi:hypothetical protein [Streptomyces avicenniae]|uniref:hypothetical protein n=1 Tax=Streptomyces avicenniae TaxID=500153 RepID=UPI000699E9A4|nr:hypothetical protein [Streptomyces avicenniae]
MHSDEQIDALLRAADPANGATPPDPEGPEALRILTRARRDARRGRLRRLVVLPAAVMLSMGTATAAVVLVTDDSTVVDSTVIGCVAPGGGLDPVEGDRYDPARGVYSEFNAVSSDPVDTCRTLLPSVGAELADDVQLTPCVDASGTVIVYPGAAGVCAEEGAAPYLGVTPEQRDLAAFRIALDASFRQDGCLPMAELQGVVDELQARHGLSGWSAVLSSDTEGECVGSVLYTESRKEITAWALPEMPSPGEEGEPVEDAEPYVEFTWESIR